MSEKIKVIVFGTESCNYCKELHKKLEASRFHENFKLEYIDCLKEMEYAQELGIERSVPFTVVFDNSEVVNKFTGHRLEEIEKCIEALVA